MSGKPSDAQQYIHTLAGAEVQEVLLSFAQCLLLVQLAVQILIASRAADDCRQDLRHFLPTSRRDSAAAAPVRQCCTAL